MCLGVMFENLSYAETEGQLEAIIGNNLVREEAYGDTHDPDSCLCPINLPETAKKAGYVYSHKNLKGEDDYIDCWFYKNVS